MQTSTLRGLAIGLALVAAFLAGMAASMPIPTTVPSLAWEVADHLCNKNLGVLDMKVYRHFGTPTGYEIKCRNTAEFRNISLSVDDTPPKKELIDKDRILKGESNDAKPSAEPRAHRR
jgi:hypothetical protein